MFVRETNFLILELVFNVCSFLAASELAVVRQKVYSEVVRQKVYSDIGMVEFANPDVPDTDKTQPATRVITDCTMLHCACANMLFIHGCRQDAEENVYI